MNKKVKILIWGIFIVYVIIMIYMLFFAEMFGRTSVSAYYRYNLTPFKEIKRFFIHRDQLGLLTAATNLIGNVVVFIPVGIMLPIFTKNKLNFLAVSLCTFNLSLFIELTQLMFKVGICDIDDLILNTFGGILGYIIYYIGRRILERQKENHEDKKI